MVGLLNREVVLKFQLTMEEEKEVNVEKEVKERENKIAAQLSNDHNVITLKGEVGQ